MKPIYKIIIISVSVLLAGLLVYFIWSRFLVPAPQPLPTPSDAVINVPLPQDATQVTQGAPTSTSTGDSYTFKRLSDKPVLGFWVSKTTGSAFYISSEGSVMEAKDGEDVAASKQTVSGFISLEASLSGEKALVSFGNPSSPQWAIFDSIDKVWRPLPKELTNVAWGGTENQLVSVIQKDGVASLSFVDISKQPYVFKTIVPNFLMTGVSFSAKSATEILISEKPSSYASSRTWQLDTKTGIMTLITSPAFGSFVKWGNSKNVLFRFSSPDKFSILDRSWSDIAPLIITTLPTKCDGGIDVVYCFIPKDRTVFTRTNSMPDDYFMNKLYTSDDLHKVVLQSGNDSPVMIGESGQIPALDADNVTYVNSSIYFTNKYDGYIYVVERQSNEIINDY